MEAVSKEKVVDLKEELEVRDELKTGNNSSCVAY